MSILDDIIAKNRTDVAAARLANPRELLEERALARRKPHDFPAALRRKGGTALIAEVKRASPAKGLLNADFDPVRQARLYEANGAAAISVLTERYFFQSDPADLGRIKRSVDVPVLRKDFLFDPWQIAEARAMGADAALLIATVLDAPLLAEMLEYATRIGLHHLVEVHDEADLDRALSTNATVIGINNRNLNTFEVRLETTQRLAGIIRRERPHAIIVSESGISSSEDVATIRGWGADAALVGEALMKSSDVPARVRELAHA